MPPNDKIAFTKKALIILVSLGISFFLVKGIFLILWSISKYTEYDIIPYYEGELAYEKMRHSGGSGDTRILERYILEGREAEKMELIADSLYTQGAKKEDILMWYDRSLFEKSSLRVQAKIEILLSLTGGMSGTSALMSSGSELGEAASEISPPPSTQSQIQESRKRIEEDAASRNRYLQKPNTLIIKDTIDYLDQGIERVDW